MAAIIMSHRGLVCLPGCPWVNPCSVGSDGSLRAALAASGALQGARMFAPNCSAVVQFSECQFEQG